MTTTTNNRVRWTENLETEPTMSVCGESRWFPRDLRTALIDWLYKSPVDLGSPWRDPDELRRRGTPGQVNTISHRSRLAHIQPLLDLLDRLVDELDTGVVAATAGVVLPLDAWWMILRHEQRRIPVLAEWMRDDDGSHPGSRSLLRRVEVLGETFTLCSDEGREWLTWASPSSVEDIVQLALIIDGHFASVVEKVNHLARVADGGLGWSDIKATDQEIQDELRPRFVSLLVDNVTPAGRRLLADAETMQIEDLYFDFCRLMVCYSRELWPTRPSATRAVLDTIITRIDGLDTED